MNVNNIRMSVKLPVSFVALSLIVALTIAWMGYRDFRSSLIVQKELLLETLVVERARSIEEWFLSVEKQLVNYASTGTSVTAIQGFTSTFPLLMENPMEELQRAYITDNPHPLGQKDKLERASETIPYNFQHEEFHKFYRALKDRMGLDDLFLIDMQGNLVYSVYKEQDFATNLETGPYKGSGLAAAYRAAKDGQLGQSFFEDFRPYAPSNDAPAGFMASPIVSPQGETLGVIAFQIPTTEVDAIVTSPQGLGVTGEITLVGDDGRARTQSRFDGRHTILDEIPLSSGTAEAIATRLPAIVVGGPALSGEAAISVTYPVDIIGNAWVLIAESEMSEVLATANRKRLQTLLTTAAAMIIVGICGWFISKAFSNPLNLVVAAMKKVSQRDYNLDLPDLHRTDEIGDLGRALSLVADRLREFDERLEREKEHAAQQRHAVTELGSGLKRLAAGDFSRSISKSFAAEYEALRIDYNETIDRLGNTIANLKDFSNTIARQTEEMGRDSNELSQRTENQASTLEETAAAIDQVTETISLNSEELRSAEKLIIETDSHVKDGRAVVESTSKAMDKIEESADEIGSIIRVVDDIAFQTNLLALNAGVEAARAGDAGRGFAVVAAEVRQLAMRSTEAVSQIKTLIDTSNANVGTGVGLVRETEKVLMEIVQRMEGISTVVSSVAAGAAEQSSSISEINAGVNNLDRVTQQNAMMVENSNASAQSLTTEASNLLEMLGRFQANPRRDNVVSLSDAAPPSQRGAEATA
ncbi:MAG: methyl-accepting chemotaxis protein [Pseudomonadota bacterium]